jgi:putative membrane protein
MTSSHDPGVTPSHDVDESVAWKRPHPGFMFVELSGTLRSLAIPFVVVFLGSDGLSDPFAPRNLIVLGIFLAIILISLAWNLMEWRFFRYALTPNRLLVRTGWISRQERSVPYQRIQSVDLVETPTYRLLGLARLRVETASGGSIDSLKGSEVDIKAVNRNEALAVREHLLRARQSARTESPAPEQGVIVEDGVLREANEAVTTDGELVRALSMRDLLIAGATSGTIGPAAAVIGAVLSMADDVVPDSWWNRVPWERVEDLSTSITVIGSLIVIVAVLAWLLAIAGTVITYYGFELRRTDEHLFVQHGLLDRRRATIPMHRIQSIRVEEGLLRQPFGLATVKYSSAGQGVKDAGGTGILFPFMLRSGVHSLLSEVAPEFAVDLGHTGLNPLPPRALSRYIVMDTFWAAVFAAGVMVGIRIWSDGLPWWGYLPLLLVPVQIVLGWLAYRDAGWHLDDQALLIRSRSVVRSTLIASRRRIQHRSITANPFQRRGRLVTLNVAVAAGLGGGTTSLAHIDKADGELLLLALNPRRPLANL